MTGRPRNGSRGARGLIPLLVPLLLCPTLVHAQARGGEELRVMVAGGEPARIPMVFHRGYAAVAAPALRSVGWDVVRRGDELVISIPGGPDLTLRIRNPFLHLGARLLQLADPPYEFAGAVHVPVQLLADLLPQHAPDRFGYDAIGRTLTVRASGPVAAAGSAGEDAGAAPTSSPAPATGPASRIVVIDAGHGGAEPGAVGPTGVREKDVALALGLALARKLEGDPEIEVRLTRDQDLYVPLWERGELATRWKGERPGVFISIHANAAPAGRSATRGFETYFLSEARTDHERRVAAAENAPLRHADPSVPLPLPDPGLESILRDLRTFDHQHWSALLAELVQGEMARSHPGPDRGVKQGPFAVITNALMPSVLVEVGFITNREEERLLTDPAFHDRMAESLAAAVRAFFARYPPGPEAL